MTLRQAFLYEYSYGMLRRVVGWVIRDVSKDFVVCGFKQSKKKAVLCHSNRSPCHGSHGLSPASHRGNTGSIARSVHVRLVVEKVALGQDSSPSTSFFFRTQYHSTNSPYSFVCHRWCIYDLSIACLENPVFKKKLSFLCLVLYQEPFLWKVVLHLCVSYMHIVMYHHKQRNVDT